MHVYHYGGYESGAIKRLTQRHATCVDEVDRLLRGDVLVDLLNVVRQGVRASVESYSLKQIEKFYMPVRTGPVTEAGFSVVAFETWLKEGDQTILDGIAAYNRDDCVSTWMLRTWLEDRRSEAVVRWPDRDWERPVATVKDPSPATTDWLRRVEERVQGLTADLAPDDVGVDAEARRLLADLLDWHRREEKSQWWRWFELKDDLTVEQLVVERDALAGLDFVDEWPGDGVMLHRRYRFDPQDHGFDPGDQPVDRGTGKSTGTIVSIDDARGLVELKRSSRSDWPHPVALIPPMPLMSVPQREATPSRGRLRSSGTASRATVRIAPCGTCSCGCHHVAGPAPVRPLSGRVRTSSTRHGGSRWSSIEAPFRSRVPLGPARRTPPRG